MESGRSWLLGFGVLLLAGCTQGADAPGGTGSDGPGTSGQDDPADSTSGAPESSGTDDADDACRGPPGEGANVGRFFENQLSAEVTFEVTIECAEGGTADRDTGTVPADQYLLSSGSDLPLRSLLVRAHGTTSRGYDEHFEDTIEVTGRGSLDVTFFAGGGQIEFAEYDA